MRADGERQDGRFPLPRAAPDAERDGREPGRVPAAAGRPRRGAALPHPRADARAGDADPARDAEVRAAVARQPRGRLRRRGDPHADRAARARLLAARGDARQAVRPHRARQGLARQGALPRARRGRPHARHGLRAAALTPALTLTLDPARGRARGHADERGAADAHVQRDLPQGDPE
eukprot:scaffold58248_cov42-Phaeocystis_antarctica.AAC.1